MLVNASADYLDYLVYFFFQKSINVCVSYFVNVNYRVVIVWFMGCSLV